MLAKQRRPGVGNDMRMNAGAHPHGRASRRTAAGGNWTEHEEHYLHAFRDAPYYSSGRNWMDYSPAYRYGYEHYVRHPGRHFEDVEARLERDWETGRATSRLAWAEARGAIRDIWRRLEQEAPGDAGTPVQRQGRR